MEESRKRKPSEGDGDDHPKRAKGEEEEGSASEGEGDDQRSCFECQSRTDVLGRVVNDNDEQYCKKCLKGPSYDQWKCSMCGHIFSLYTRAKHCDKCDDDVCEECAKRCSPVSDTEDDYVVCEYCEEEE